MEKKTDEVKSEVKKTDETVAVKDVKEPEEEAEKSEAATEVGQAEGAGATAKEPEAKMSTSPDDDDEEIPILIPSDEKIEDICESKIEKLKLTESKESVADKVLNQLKIDQEIDLKKLQDELDEEEKRNAAKEDQKKLAEIEKQKAAEDEQRMREKEERKRKVFRSRPHPFSPALDSTSALLASSAPGLMPSYSHGCLLTRDPVTHLPIDPLTGLPLDTVGPLSLDVKPVIHEPNNNELLGSRRAEFNTRHPMLGLQKSASAIIRPAATDLGAGTRSRLHDYDPTFSVYSRLDSARRTPRASGGTSMTRADPGLTTSNSKLDDVYFGSASARRYKRIREEAKTRSMNPIRRGDTHTRLAEAATKVEPSRRHPEACAGCPASCVCNLCGPAGVG